VLKCKRPSREGPTVDKLQANVCAHIVPTWCGSHAEFDLTTHDQSRDCGKAKPRKYAFAPGAVTECVILQMLLTVRSGP